MEEEEAVETAAAPSIANSVTLIQTALEVAKATTSSVIPKLLVKPLCSARAVMVSAALMKIAVNQAAIARAMAVARRKNMTTTTMMCISQLDIDNETPIKLTTT